MQSWEPGQGTLSPSQRLMFPAKSIKGSPFPQRAGIFHNKWRKIELTETSAAVETFGLRRESVLISAAALEQELDAFS